MRGVEGRFELLGGVDIDQTACDTFKYLTGVEQLCMDIRKLTPEKLRALLGPTAPDVVMGSAPCLPAHGLIVTDRGTERIDSLDVGRTVLTHKGRHRKIVAIGKEKYDGTMYGLRLRGSVDVQEFTHEHPLYVRKFWAPYRDGRQKLELGPPQFVKAGDLKKGKHLIGFPLIRERLGCADAFVGSLGDPTVVQTKQIDGDLLPNGKKRQRTSPKSHLHGCGRTVDLRREATNPSLWFLFGVYLGDGYHVKTDRYTTSFCVGHVNSVLAQKVRLALASIGLDGRNDMSSGETNIKIVVNSKHLTLLVSLFGSSSYNKRIPHELFDLETELVAALVDGYRASDGSDVRRTGKDELMGWKAPSVSLELLRGIQRLLLRVGKFGGIHNDARAGRQCIQGRWVPTAQRWAISVNEAPLKRSNVVFDDTHVWMSIANITNRQTKEDVWNIEVEEDNTFCVPMMATHNCQASSALITNEKALEPKYEALNELTLVLVDLIFATWEKPPAIMMFENVPNIRNRAKNVVDRSAQKAESKRVIDPRRGSRAGEVRVLLRCRRSRRARAVSAAMADVGT